MSEDQPESATADVLSALTGGGNGTSAVSNIPGLQIRFNADVAPREWAARRRGSTFFKICWMKIIFVRTLSLRPRKGGPDRPNEEVIGQSLMDALKAVTELHRQRPDMDLSSLTPAVDALTRSSNPEVRTEAEKTKLSMQSPRPTVRTNAIPPRPIL